MDVYLGVDRRKSKNYEYIVQLAQTLHRAYR